MDDSAIICDEIIKSYDEKKTIPRNFNEKNITCKTQNFYILLAFLLITITLLIAVSTYRYLIKYQAKQKHKIKTNLYRYYKLKMSYKVKDINTKRRTYYFSIILLI